MSYCKENGTTDPESSSVRFHFALGLIHGSA